MKLILVSDPHLVKPGEELFGSDPLANFEACIASINREHADADLVVFAGDITNDGEASAYAAAADQLEELVPPYRLIPGNHDERSGFARAFPASINEDGFAHASLDVDGTRLILLDTLWPGNVAGKICEKRLAWLDGELAAASDALLVMHHPAFEIGIPSMDDCRLREPELLLEVLRLHGNVRHIFAGHVHLFSSGHWDGIPFTTLRSTNHQSALAFTGPHRLSFEAPAYHIVRQIDQGIVTHLCEFLQP